MLEHTKEGTSSFTEWSIVLSTTDIKTLFYDDLAAGFCFKQQACGNAQHIFSACIDNVCHRGVLFTPGN